MRLWPPAPRRSVGSVLARESWGESPYPVAAKSACRGPSAAYPVRVSEFREVYSAIAIRRAAADPSARAAAFIVGTGSGGRNDENRGRGEDSKRFGRESDHPYALSAETPYNESTDVKLPVADNFRPLPASPTNV